MADLVTTQRAVGPIVRAIREAQGRRADEVAAAAGVTKSYLSLVETGRRRATADPTARIAAALGVPVEILTGQMPALGALRLQHNLARDDLARDVGITVALLERLERGHQLPTPAQVRRLARRLAVDERAIDPHVAPPAQAG